MRVSGIEAPLDANCVEAEIAMLKISQMEQRDEQLRKEEEETKRKLDAQKFRALLSWLSQSADPTLYHETARKLQTAGTGRWFLDGQAFHDWKDADNSFLWIYGIPGAGKTILSSLIIDQLDQDLQDSNKALAYFYCDSNNPAKHTPEIIYGSLIAQLVQAVGSWPNVLDGITDLISGSPPKFEDLKEYLHRVLETGAPAVIVIDALDVCPRRVELLESLKELHEGSVLKLNILLISRNMPDIRDALAELPSMTIKSTNVSSDINRYVNSEIERQPRLAKLKKEIKDEIISVLTTKANGMFLWVKCHLENIVKLRINNAIKAALRTLPPGIYPVYERVLEDIQDEHKVIAQRVFNWLVCSKRPMSVVEVVEAIAVDLGTDNLDQEDKLNDPEETLLEICGGLVLIEEKTTIESSEKPMVQERDLQTSRTLIFAHSSVKDFFTSKQLEKSAQSDYFVSIMETNYQLAKVCVTYLTFEDFDRGPCRTNEEFIRRHQEHPFLVYAADYWHLHALGHHSSEDLSFIAVMERLFTTEAKAGCFRAWLQVHQRKSWTISDALKRGVIFEVDDTPEARLVWASRLGVCSVVELLLQKGANPNSYVNQLGLPGVESALIGAVKNGHIEIVEILLGWGADTNGLGLANAHRPTKSCSNYSPLTAAIKYRAGDDKSRTLRMLQLLLQKGAYVNLKLPRDRYVLLQCIEESFPEAVRLCLEAGADINVEEDTLRAIEFAAILHKPKCFDVLIEFDAAKQSPHPLIAPFAVAGNNGYALFMAAQAGSTDATEKLLKIDGEKILEESPMVIYHTIRRAANFGYEKVLELLLTYYKNWSGEVAGEPVSAFTKALEEACLNGHKAAVQLLIERTGGLSVWRYERALQLAVTGDHTAIVDMMLAHGCDPYAPSEDGWTATLCARVYERHEICAHFQLLADNSVYDKTLKPTAWKPQFGLIREYSDPSPKGLIIVKQIIEILPDAGEESSRIVIHPDRLIPVRKPYYYFEVTIVEDGKGPVMMGLADARLSFDEEKDHFPRFRTDKIKLYTCFDSTGVMRTYKYENKSWPTYGAGDVIGCGVDLLNNKAFFTKNGEIIVGAVGNVKGMVYAVVQGANGTKISANFGDEPFLFDTGKLLSTDQLEVRYQFDSNFASEVDVGDYLGDMLFSHPE